ncbi:MAG: YgiQ family radical SAM protein [Candidatus Muiribacteriaceae bacterium]
MLIRLTKDSPDIILVTGDHYIDHPCYGIAIIARVLQNKGYSVWICAAPSSEDNFRELRTLPKPKLFFGVSSGNMDSTLSLYTVNKVKRKKISSDHLTRNMLISYVNSIRSSHRESMIICGGLEASIRRFVHYDFFTDRIRPGMLEDASADYLVFGMAEHTVSDIALACAEDRKESINNIRGICFRTSLNKPEDNTTITLPSFSEICEDPIALSRATDMVINNSESSFFQKNRKHSMIFNPPQHRLSESEMDSIYDLNYSYRPIPDTEPPPQGFETVKNTVVTHRGCGGGCSFCSITIHQGKKISSRSLSSITKEIEYRKMKTVSDLQAPTANMYASVCKNPANCHRYSCLYPSRCRFLKINEIKYIRLLSTVNKLCRNAFIQSGIRFDIISDTLLDFLIQNNFISGQIKVAPEHSDPEILRSMHKPDFSIFSDFVERFRKKCRKYKKELYIIPYIISSFPGADEKNTKRLRKDLIQLLGFVPFQIQDFTPTPGTPATAMYVRQKRTCRTNIRRLRSLLLNDKHHTKKKDRYRKNHKKKH